LAVSLYMSLSVPTPVVFVHLSVVPQKGGLLHPLLQDSPEVLHELAAGSGVDGSFSALVTCSRAGAAAKASVSPGKYSVITLGPG